MATLQQRIQRLEDLHAIQNLMAVYTQKYHAMIKMTEQMDEIWSKRDDIAFENQGLVYTGQAAVRKKMAEVKKMHADGNAAGVAKAFPGEPVDPLAGKLILHMLTTPVLEVAEDGQTAKGMWIAFGGAAGATPNATSSGSYFNALWMCLKFGVDFIKEEGKWKMWHLATLLVFASPYDKSWVEQALAEKANPTPPRPAPPAEPGVRPIVEESAYSVTRGPKEQPKLPEPYKTFKDTFTY